MTTKSEREKYNQGRWDGFNDWLFWSQYSGPSVPYRERTPGRKLATWIFALIMWPLLAGAITVAVWCVLFLFTNWWDQFWLPPLIGGLLAFVFCAQLF